MLDDPGGYPANSDQRPDWRFVICRKPPAAQGKIEQLGGVFLTVNLEWCFRLRDRHKGRVASAGGVRTIARELSQLF